MKALTLTQPWAQLVADGRKGWETRSWRTSYVGPIAIHAAKGWTTDDQELLGRWLGLYPDEVVRGAIIAVAAIALIVPTSTVEHYVSVEELSFGDYSRGRFAWRLDKVRKLDEPIPCRGALGLWTVPADVRELLGNLPSTAMAR